jgi:transposase InsO family protein
MTYLPTEVAGRWVFLYLIFDIYRRKIVGWEVHDTDDADHAALAEGVAVNQTKPVMHGDNEATLKATTALAMRNWLGTKPLHSRPRMSNNNAFAKSAFRTAQYRPEFLKRGYKDLDLARSWASQFVQWHNVEHLQRAIRYVSPSQRHDGEDHEILTARHAAYLAARNANPRRGSGKTKN